MTENVGHGLLQVLQSTVGSVAAAVAACIIFLYVFVSLLVKQDKVLTLLRQLNPLGRRSPICISTRSAQWCVERSRASS